MKPSSQIPESANPDKESTQNAAGGNGSSACDTTARQGRKHRAVDQMYQYLLKRGVLLCTAQNHGAIFDENPTADRIRSRLNEDITYSGYPLSTLAKAILWLPMFQQEAGPSYVAKPFFKFFPHSNGEPPKFLFPTNSDALPFVARTVWDQRKKIEIPIVLTEGPVKTYALSQAGANVIGVGGVWMAAKRQGQAQNRFVLHPVLAEFDWVGRKIYLAFDADWTSNRNVRQALIRTALVLSVYGADVQLLTTWEPAKGKGIDDYLVKAAEIDPAADPEGFVAKQRKALNALFLLAIPFFESIRPHDLILVEHELRVVVMSAAKRAQLCKLLSKPLGVRATVLERGASNEEERDENLDRLQAMWGEDPEPSADPVDGSDLLHEICRFVRRVVVLSDNAVVTCCLWIIMTYIYERFDQLPLLRIKSPEKRCGKTTLLKVVSLLVPHPLLTGNISAAGLYRIVEKYHPTVFVDEADGFVKDNEDLRNIFNNGYEKGVPTIRVNPETLEPILFNTFGPKALASIGPLQGTIEDRGLVVVLQRKSRSQKTERLRRISREEVLTLRSKILRWVEDNAEAINAAVPKESPLLDDRAWDKWEPLMQIAVVMSGDGPERALKAALKAETEVDTDFRGALLLGLRGSFKARTGCEKDDFLSTDTLLEDLNADKEAPWAEWRGDKGLSARRLGNTLKEYGVSPVRAREEAEKKEGQKFVPRLRGYLYGDLSGVFEKYLPPEKGDDDPSPPSSGGGSESGGDDPTGEERNRESQKDEKAPKNDHVSYSKSAMEASSQTDEALSQEKNNLGRPPPKNASQASTPAQVVDSDRVTIGLVEQAMCPPGHIDPKLRPIVSDSEPDTYRSVDALNAFLGPGGKIFFFL